jgi:hypothetical protein
VRGFSARPFRSNCNGVCPPPEIFSNIIALAQDRAKMRQTRMQLVLTLKELHKR